MRRASTSIAVLTSGGLDSAILVADLCGQYARVQPLYVREGLYWEPVELEHLRRFLQAIEKPPHPTLSPSGGEGRVREALGPLVVLEMPVKDVYGEHWSVTGRNVPGADSPDQAVNLPGRNLLLLAKALPWCRLHGVPELALGPLASNPFPDASDEFFVRMEELAAQALEGRVAIRRPYARLHKTEVLARGKGLPLEWTFSCIRPVEGKHCGRCNKCGERKKAFADAGMTDPTEYA
jgi:7-cyano-7-deazaguanine synthase